MLDDEYTRIVLARDVRAMGNRDAQSKLPAIIRSLQRPTASAFVEYLARQTTDTIILAPDGKPMGEMIDADRARVDATGARMIKALHFVETKTALPSSALVKIGSKAGLRAHDQDTLKIARAFSKFADQRHREIGTAFSYMACFAPGISVWLMLLYDYHFWLGTIDARDSRATPA